MKRTKRYRYRRYEKPCSKAACCSAPQIALSLPTRLAIAMADIFLSYTHIDELRAQPIVELLETQGWTVWWDCGIEPGTPWRPELDIELANCRAVIVLWSHTS